MIVLWIEYVLVSVLIVFVLLFISSLFSVNEKTSGNVEMYECGIESLMDQKAPFYLHFFLIGILFLLFDVELIVCIPMVWMIVFEEVWGMLWFFFFFILFVGLVLEIIMGTFSWKE